MVAGTNTVSKRSVIPSGFGSTASTQPTSLTMKPLKVLLPYRCTVLGTRSRKDRKCAGEISALKPPISKRSVGLWILKLKKSITSPIPLQITKREKDGECFGMVKLLKDGAVPSQTIFRKQDGKSRMACLPFWNQAEVKRPMVATLSQEIHTDSLN